MAERLAIIVHSDWFRNFVTGVIILAGVLVGLETYPAVMESYGGLIRFLDFAVLMIFVIEIMMRIGAYGRHPFRYFMDGWNIFDFTVVMVCLLPVKAGFFAVVRLARILRVLRLITTLPKLQLLVGALLKAIPSIGYITVLLFIHFYIYACLGTMFFGKNDPLYFGTLHVSMVSLFQVVTLEGWTDMLMVQMYGSANVPYHYSGSLPIVSQASPLVAVAYFISYILFGTMIILNLFVGVILNGMAEMQEEARAKELYEKRQAKNISASEELQLVLADMDDLRRNLNAIRQKVARQDADTG